MTILQVYDFFRGAAEPGVSKELYNDSADILSLQVIGASGSYLVEGKGANAGENDWVTLGAINVGNFSLTTGAIQEPGLYEIGVAGVRTIRVSIQSTLGEVTIIGSLVESSN